MPAIYLFQRRTLYGGDDLHVLALMTATARLAQLLCYSVLAYHGQHHVSSFAQGGRGLQGGTMQLGISTLEFGWMDAWEQRQQDRSLQDDNNNNDKCDHWFPFLLTSYTMAGIVFGVASLLLLARIYQVSSQGCPTIHRHPRTERMQQLLEWLFLPLNILHFLVWLVGMAAMSYAYSFEQQRDECHSTTSVSTFFTVLWIASGILLLLSQAIEIVWNALYVFVLYYNDPHAMIWTPNNSNNSSSSLLLHSQSYHHQSSSNTITNSDTTLQPPIQTYYDNHALVEQMWSDRCHNCCQWLGLGTCYIFGGKDLYGGNGALHYGDFARAMADYLETRGVLDVVPSDIIVGFLVLQQLQVQRRHVQRQEVLSEHTKQSSYFMTTNNNNNNNDTTTEPLSLSLSSSQHKTQLHNHRANIANGNSPKGMRLSKSTASLEQHQLPTPQDLLRASNNNNTTKTRPSGLLQSMGSMDAPQQQQRLLNNNDNQDSVMTTRGASFDHSSPPPPKVRSFRRQQSAGSGSSTFVNEQPANQFRSFQRLLSEQNRADVMVLQDGSRYAKYALAIYTWYLYLYVHPITGIPRLCAKAWNSNIKCGGGGCCCCSASSSQSLDGVPMNNNNNNNNNGSAANHAPPHRWEGDNICQAHKHALLLAAGLDNEADLVYVQLKNSFSDNPYCILLDHENQTVVLSVRGTFSLEDCVTDVLLEPECLEALGDEFGFADMAKGQHCHGGVLACARNVYRDLKRHGSLEYLLESKYPQYQLRLVGHSLGAATATMLGFMLKPAYPTLQCFNYSPPGATMTWDMAIQCQSWCTSFVLDCELVPRLSFEALEYLRDEVLDLIGRIRVSKLEVARRVATKTLWCGKKKLPNPRNEYDLEQAITSVDELDDLLSDLLLPSHEVPDTPEATSYRQQLEQFQSVQSERRSARGTRRTIRLFPPGRILHLVKTDEEQSCGVQVAKCLTCCMSNAGSLYTPCWIGNGDLNEIVISPTMGTDHFPDRMVTELEGIVRNFGLEQR